MRLLEWKNYDDTVSGVGNWVYDDAIYLGRGPLAEDVLGEIGWIHFGK